jgi:hypothetical protein
MVPRVLRCAIEEVSDLHVNLFLEPHVVAFVAVTGRYARSPALFEVECDNVVSRLLDKSSACRLELSWQEDTAEKARRLRATMQSAPLVELAKGKRGKV